MLENSMVYRQLLAALNIEESDVIQLKMTLNAAEKLQNRRHRRLIEIVKLCEAKKKNN